ncbi:hypothetical protein P153DRAFT_147298 [Dothidotthia symphoricarpi CBS 119687]|uniref:Uncharacterized protein n=1 Tax=Dothidotthia symphoricarpi CBS 119687 TaxID=1392245 RepID=A0A6A5ZZC5_9PLEO|nr:uncharacterized protein P153DRAFT_147298 [Dothidotthia symphoricarpi CBS 119687]KAF2123671.1 hypothetical protein P153DRAFT_147298 [Dothidotthia symphoricarpi CBS 119687]
MYTQCTDVIYRDVILESCSSMLPSRFPAAADVVVRPRAPSCLNPDGRFPGQQVFPFCCSVVQHLADLKILRHQCRPPPQLLSLHLRYSRPDTSSFLSTAPSPRFPYTPSCQSETRSIGQHNLHNIHSQKDRHCWQYRCCHSGHHRMDYDNDAFFRAFQGFPTAIHRLYIFISTLVIRIFSIQSFPHNRVTVLSLYHKILCPCSHRGKRIMPMLHRAVIESPQIVGYSTSVPQFVVS